MEALIPAPANCEVRLVIKFLNAQSIVPIEIHRQLCRVYGPNIISKQMVRCWFREFSTGRQSVHDDVGVESDVHSVLHVNFLTRGEMVNAERYCETLQKL
jgi:hypothetical protein